MLLLPILALLTAALSTPVLSSSHTHHRRNPASFLSCLSTSSLVPTTSSNGSYTADIAAYNQRIQPLPLAILHPGSASEIGKAVKCAGKSGISVSARGGGHSYASFGLGGTDGALVIDLARFKKIKVLGDGTVRVGAGNRLGDIALALAANGRAMPHGTCPFVGIGGHASFGGFGYAGRMWGLAVDQVVAVDVVLANGTVVAGLNQAKDADLFWALRGSAPSFGLITSFTFKTYPMPPTTINFSYRYDSPSPSLAASIFLLYQSFGSLHAPPTLGIALTASRGGSLEIGGVFYGTMDEFHNTMVTFVESLPAGRIRTVLELSWVDSLKRNSGRGDLNTIGASDSRDDFFVKSLMTPQIGLVTYSAALAFFTYIYQTPTSTNWFVEINLYGGAGSVINALPLSANAFAHRSSLLTFQMYASSPTYSNPYPAEGFNFVNGMYAAIVNPMASTWGSTVGAYVNYVDPTLTPQQVSSLYWGSQYPRLATLRGKYDPQAVFKNPQSIVAA